MADAAQRDPGRDQALAGSILSRICEANHADGCNDLALLYLEGTPDTPQDTAKVVALFTKSCDLGSPYGCANLGWSNWRGELGLPQDLVEAEALLGSACGDGFEFACENLLEMFRRSQIGSASKALASAASRFREACEQGSADGCASLGYLAWQGGGGVPSNRKNAETLLGQACRGGSEFGCKTLDRVSPYHRTRGDRATDG
ncbi:tetratricopeptide repeat protein [Amaricoccus sp.]|uniref:tetratricopeptide repeat protein n=1 Tax=Amaricoccus sp. TaxID=1872485 RepID=UPI003FA54078